MNKRQFVLALASTGLAARAQTRHYPDRPITILVPFPAGSGADLQMRVLSQPMAELLKVPVVVQNLPGGEGAVAFNALRNAPADGYTLFRTTSTTQVFNAILLKKPPFDPVRDLRPIAGLTRIYQVMLVPAQSSVRSVSDFIASARTGPSRSYAGASSGRFSAAMFASMAGLDLLHVPYKGVPPALTDLAGGVVDLMFSDLPAALPLIQGGRVRPIAVTSPRRLGALPDVQTLQEAGLANFEFAAWAGLYARAGTPDALIDVLSQAISAANRSDAVAKFLADGSLTRFDASPEELARFQADDLRHWQLLAARMNIHPE